jgi:hypothetical protein
MRHILGSPPLDGAVRAASPTAAARLYLVDGADVLPLDARGGIPSLERALGDPETASVTAWTDVGADAAWTAADPSSILRSLDRFHSIPEAGAWRESWAEWLYFNARGEQSRFYLTFIVGPATRDDAARRHAAVRLQLEHGGRTRAFSIGGEIDEASLLAEGPDVTIAGNRVRLDGMHYRISLALPAEGGGPAVAGEVVLEGVPGSATPPIEIRGVGGWVSGYVVPVLSGSVTGSLRVGSGEPVVFDGAVGYHDHNWGFWERVTWQWGQTASDDLSLVWGRVQPPPDAADPERIPGFLAVLGPDGLVGFASAIRVEELDGPRGIPERLSVRASAPSLDVRLAGEVTAAHRNEFALGGPYDRGRLDLVQMRARFAVEGHVAGRDVRFVADGSAETFRGRPAERSEPSR